MKRIFRLINISLVSIAFISYSAFFIIWMVELGKNWGETLWFVAGFAAFVLTTVVCILNDLRIIRGGRLLYSIIAVLFCLCAMGCFMVFEQGDWFGFESTGWPWITMGIFILFSICLTLIGAVYNLVIGLLKK
ncbi:MAG: hypothetical protein GXY57_01475 [Erysipelotrichaceae bacterium]|nr:hypothetical protein [Erysipelotrichaceae bacterium]